MLKRVPSQLKKLLKYPEVIGIGVLLIVLIIGVWVGTIDVPRTGPIEGPGSNPYLLWKLTERDGSGNLLKNNLSDTAQEPNYPASGAYQLNRDIDGSLELYRFQGELEYHD